MHLFLRGLIITKRSLTFQPVVHQRSETLRIVLLNMLLVRRSGLNAMQMEKLLLTSRGKRMARDWTEVIESS